jgi:hypothetical protein
MLHLARVAGLMTLQRWATKLAEAGHVGPFGAATEMSFNSHAVKKGVEQTCDGAAKVRPLRFDVCPLPPIWH